MISYFSSPQLGAIARNKWPPLCGWYGDILTFSDRNCWLFNIIQQTYQQLARKTRNVISLCVATNVEGREKQINKWRRTCVEDFSEMSRVKRWRRRRSDCCCVVLNYVIPRRRISISCQSNREGRRSETCNLMLNCINCFRPPSSSSPTPRREERSLLVSPRNRWNIKSVCEICKVSAATLRTESYQGFRA